MPGLVTAQQRSCPRGRWPGTRSGIAGGRAEIAAKWGLRGRRRRRDVVKVSKRLSSKIEHFFYPKGTKPVKLKYNLF